MHAHRIVECTHERHARAILDIYNDVIATSTAIYAYEPRTIDSMGPWFDVRRAGAFPVIGAEGHDGELLAFGSYATFRASPAYKYTVEHSVYVHRDQRGHGLGRVVLDALIDRARRQGIHALIGGLDAGNAASIALHERCGFTRVGLLPQVGFKFGRWLDLAFYQLLLDTPADPVDG